MSEMNLEPDSIIGSYRVIRPLGQGGMAAAEEPPRPKKRGIITGLFAAAILIAIGIGTWFYLQQGHEPLRLDDLYSVPLAAPDR